jgi:hypothetical protein
MNFEDVEERDGEQNSSLSPRELVLICLVQAFVFPSTFGLHRA